MMRVFGRKDASEGVMVSVRGSTGLISDDFCVDSAVAFLLLALYWQVGTMRSCAFIVHSRAS